MTGNHITMPPGAARQCLRCGALGTHYLTCPILRLPRDYRLSQDPPLSAPVTAGKQHITRRPATDGQSSAEATSSLPVGLGAAGQGHSARDGGR
jgi:hypothetical protein